MTESIRSKDSLVVVERVERRRPENAPLRARIDGLRKEYETDLAEARHRFANCFQLISSLIQLRLKQASSAENRAHLSGLQNLILALGLLQRHLTVSAGGTAFGTFLAEQVCLWRPLCAEQGIEIALDFDEIEVPAGNALPLALIVNELVTNCLEHAFPDGKGGRIRIALKPSGDGRGELVVADNGVGPTAGRGAPQSLGLRLIERLSAQADGTFSIEENDGATARIRFSLA